MKITTWRPKKIRRKRKHGFLRRSRSKSGRNVIKRRIQKGRRRITV